MIKRLQFILIFSLSSAILSAQTARPTSEGNNSNQPKKVDGGKLQQAHEYEASANSAKVRRMMKSMADENFWCGQQKTEYVTRDLLLESLKIAKVYLLRSRNEKNLHYRTFYDFKNPEIKQAQDTSTPEDGSTITEEPDKGNGLTQSATTWLLAYLAVEHTSPAIPTASAQALNFWISHTQHVKEGVRAPLYPKTTFLHSECIAMQLLAYINALDAFGDVLNERQRTLYQNNLENTFNIIHKQLKQKDGGWATGFDISTAKNNLMPNPLGDSLCLLAYCKMIRKRDHKELIPVIEKTMHRLSRRYGQSAWLINLENPTTSQFYAYGMMAMAEYVEADWKDSDIIANTAFAMTWAILHRHEILLDRGNNSYTLLGLLSVYHIAQIKKNQVVKARLRPIIDKLLLRYTRWQVDGPLNSDNKKENFYLAFKQTPVEVTGGIMNGQGSGVIVLDIMQHQMMADILALKYIYTDKEMRGHVAKNAIMGEVTTKIEPNKPSKGANPKKPKENPNERTRPKLPGW